MPEEYIFELVAVTVGYRVGPTFDSNHGSKRIYNHPALYKAQLNFDVFEIGAGLRWLQWTTTTLPRQHQGFQELVPPRTRRMC